MRQHRFPLLGYTRAGIGRRRTWSADIALPVAVQEVAVTALGNQVYVVGGSNGQTRVNTVYTFNPASPSTGWTTRTPYPPAQRAITLESPA